MAGELSGELWLGARDGDGWREVQVIATSTRDGLVQPSGIATDGTRVYVANRGVDTISAFDVDGPAGTLTPVAEFDVRRHLAAGHHPRPRTALGLQREE